jgi:hypothetical protein
MAGPLAAVERFFERLFERPAARLFQARLEPVHLQRHLERAMEGERRVEAHRSYVPSHYRVRLHPTDMASLEAYGGSLAADLADMLHAYARRNGYLLRSRPQVVLAASPGVAPGEVVVDPEAIVARARTTLSAPLAGLDRRRDVEEAQRPAVAAASDPGDARAQALASPGSPTTFGAPPAVSNQSSGVEGGGTAVYVAPSSAVPAAVLAVHVPGRPVWRVPVNRSTLRIGRALDNDLVLPDERVSRHHGQLSVRLGMLVYTDLGSTNGSFLNGSSVTEIALGPTDVLQLGGSSVIIESGS